MQRLLPPDGLPALILKRLMFPWTMLAVSVLIAVVAPLSVYPHSQPVEIVFAVVAGLLAVVVILNTLLTGAQEWQNHKLPRFLQKRHHATLSLLASLDVLFSNAVIVAGVMMSFWVNDQSHNREHYYFFLEQKNSVQTVWTAFVYFLSSAGFIVIGTAAFGPLLPIEPETTAFASAFCVYGKVVDVMILSICIYSLSETKDKERRKRKKLKAQQQPSTEQLPPTITRRKPSANGYSALPTTHQHDDRQFAQQLAMLAGDGEIHL